MIRCCTPKEGGDDMDERLIEFKGGPSRQGRRRPRVTLSSRGVFLLSKAALSALKNPEAVKLFYDPHKQVIGIQAALIREANAFPVRLHATRNFNVNAPSFCKHFDIKVLRTIEFNNPRVGDDGIMRLNLTDTTIIGREPSARKRS